MTTEGYDPFIEQKIAERRERIGGWRQAQQANSYLQLNEDPSDLPDYYAQDPAATPAKVPGTGGVFSFDVNLANKMQEEYVATRRSEYTVAYEKALAENRKLDYEFLLQFEPADLGLIGAVDKETVEDLEDIILERAMEEQRLRDVDLAVEKEIEERSRMSKWKQGVMRLVASAGNPFGMVGGMLADAGATGPIYVGTPTEHLQTLVAPDLDEEQIRWEEEMYSFGRGDEIYNDDIETFMANMKVTMENKYDTIQFAHEVGGGVEDFEFSSDKDAWVASMMKDMEASVRFQLKDHRADVTEVLDQDGTFTNNVEWTLGAVGGAIGGALRFVTGVGQAASYVLPDAIDPYYYLRQSAEESRDQTIAEAARWADNDRGIDLEAANIMRGDIRAEWSKLQEERPDIFESRLQEAGFDPILAFAMFAQEVKDMPGAEEQMAALADGIRQNGVDTVRVLNENDFRVSDKTLDYLASWGKFVNRLATTTGLLLTEEDYHGDGITNAMAEAWEGSKSFESPAELVGLDGTLAGLLVDLGAGIAFDPTTWIFGPRGAARSVKAYTMAQINDLAKGPMVKQFMREAVEGMQSSSRGAAAVIHSIRWMDDLARGEFLAATAWKPSILPRGAWGRIKGHKAMETKIDFVREVAGEATHQTKKAAKAVDDVRRQIEARGFDEPLVIQVSRVNNSMRLSDGSKRLAAAEQILIDGEKVAHVPVVFELVDDAFGMADNVDPRWAELATGRKLERSGEKVDVDIQKNLPAQTEMLSKSGLKVKQVGDVVDGFTVKRVTSSGTNYYWIEDAAGNKVSFLQSSADGGGGAANVVGMEKQGLFSRMVTEIEKFDPEVILNLAKSGSVSDTAADWLMKWAAKKVPAVTKKLDDYVDPGGELLKVVDDPGTGAVRVRPDELLARDKVWGEFDEAAMEAIATRAIQRGGVPDGAYRGLIAQAWHGSVGNYIRNNTPNSGITRYMTQNSIITRLELVGPGAMDRIYDVISRMWGDDMVGMNRWTEAVMRYEQEAARTLRKSVDRAVVLKSLRKGLETVEDMTGGTWDDSLRQLQQAPEGSLVGRELAEAKQAFANRRQAQEVKHQLRRDFDEAYQAANRDMMKMADTRQLADLVMDMYDDFNLQHIATNKVWRKSTHADGTSFIDDATGQVVWDNLRKGSTKSRENMAVAQKEAIEGSRRYLGTHMSDTAKDLGIQGDELARKMLATQDYPMAVDLPLSPLEMVMAKSAGGASYTRWTHKVFVGNVREVAFNLNKMWVIDKVFRASTAMTVSFDELLRIWHIGGPEAAIRWGRDRAIFMEARAKAALHGDPFWKEGVKRGSKYMSAQKRARIEALQNIPNHLRAAERQLYDSQGLGWTDIAPDSPQYMEAASRWTAGLLQDTGFRAFLRGEDAFREWFHGVDGQRLRDMSVLDKGPDGTIGTRVLAGADEAYQSFTSLFDRIILANAKKTGHFDDVRQAFVDTANKIDGLGGRAQELPAFVYDHLGPVRGAQKHIGKKWGVSNVSEKFFDNLFMNPVNYRRGFLAELVRKTEGQRIRQLYELQNKRILTDLEAENALGMVGLEGASRVGAKGYLHEMAARQNIITESMLDDIIEKAVQKEIDNVLYTWDRGSRLGSQSRAVFPFGKPWADMAGFWGKEIMRRPVVRGMWNQENFLGIKGLNTAPLVNGIERFTPFNPKPAAMMSRLANTDFTVDRGFIGEREGGLLPGSTSSDFSPIFFLPTGGDNPFAAMIPGLGFVPMQMMDWVLDVITDPIEDPEGYQQWIDEISDFLPMFRYQQGGAISRTVGGGSAGALVGGAVDILGLRSGEVGTVDTYFGFTSKLGDITREISRTREISAILSDPEVIEDLLLELDPTELEAQLMGLAQQADGRASGSHLAETLTRWIVPMNNRFDQSIADILDVWVDAAESFPELVPGKPLDESDPASVRQYANDVRKAFFDLPPWRRDLMIAQQPTLAVNLVSSWEWTESAVSANLPNVDKSYRTGGSSEDSSRHQYYVEQGFVRPLQPLERARRILGMMFAAKDSAAKEMYTTQAGVVNDTIWEVGIAPDTMAMLENAVASGFGKEWDIRSARELWENWGSMEERYEQWWADERGLDVELVKSGIGIPNVQKPWGTTWPGINPDEVSQKFGDITISVIDPKIQELADGLGLTLTAGMTGAQFYNEIQTVLTQIEGPAATHVKSVYDQYVNSRIVPSNSAENALRRTAYNTNYSIEWRAGVEKFMVQADSIAERYMNEAGGIPNSEAQRVVDSFNALKMTAGDEIGWDKIWEDRYERTYGALDWTPPSPPAPVDADGRISQYATAPYFERIIDGDSFEVRENRGDGHTFEVRLLGVRAAEWDEPQGPADKKRLEDALEAGRARGDTIWLVRDPKTFGSSTDYYGRMLAWLWIGDEPYYFEEDFDRRLDPSGGER